MRTFNNIANLIKTKRINHPKSYSQVQLSELLGYKNGQFISNVERGLCSVPLNMIKKVSEILEIPPHELKESLLKDHEETLSSYFDNKSV